MTVLNSADVNWLAQFGNINPGVTAALKAAGAQSSYNGVGLCLEVVRKWWGIPAGALTAAKAWAAIPGNETHTFYTPPPGVPVFWTGGSAGDGHIALSVGGGYVRSTDIGGNGTVTTVAISEITSKWKLKYAGWGETLNGVRVYTQGNA